MELDELTGINQQAFRKLFESRILYLKGPLEDTNADPLVAQMLALDAESKDDITLYVNSPGGIISGLFAIFDTMQLLRSKVNTRCVGMAASAAAVILASGTGTRSATENARIMIHQPLGGARGSARDIEIQAQNIVYLRERINEILAERTGQPVEKIREDTDRDFWLTAAEAREYGLIDQVVGKAEGPTGG
ncbi:MAG: ATP-dependent Clp protease proteolytic subunit [Actinomycetota bacterium]|nr:ATP-dependent Clp protease proteolytic subunit [Actinomycetota bacterium]